MTATLYNDYTDKMDMSIFIHDKVNQERYSKLTFFDVYIFNCISRYNILKYNFQYESSHFITTAVITIRGNWLWRF